MPLHALVEPYLSLLWEIFLNIFRTRGFSTVSLDIIPPVRRHGKLLHPERKARADLVATARLDGLFGQRWKTETVNSVIKRKFGDTIRSRKTQLQMREPIIKALVYNIHR
jgi:hypothetical protein